MKLVIAQVICVCCAVAGLAQSEAFRISQMGPEGNPDFDAFRPAMAYNSTRNELIVVWHGEQTVPDLFDIYAQRISATGQKLGDVVRISDASGELDGSFPDIAYNPANDEYLVVWHEDGPEDNEFEIYGQFLSGDGQKIGGIQQLSFVLANQPRSIFPAVVYNPSDNEYLVVWEASPNFINDIFGQRISGASRTRVGEAVNISLGNTLIEFDPAFNADIAFDSQSNRYFVVWDGNAGPFGALLPADLSSITPTFLCRAPDQSILEPSVVGSNGQFLVACERSSDRPESLDFEAIDAISGQHEFFRHGLYTGGNQSLPAVGVDTKLGTYFAVWENTKGEDSLEVLGLQIDSQGTFSGDPDLISNTFLPLERTSAQPALVFLNSGEVAVIWTSDLSGPGEFEIYGRIRAPIQQLPDFRPEVSVTLNGLASGTLPAGQPVEISRETRLFLDDRELPGSRSLSASQGSIDFASLSVGTRAIESEFQLTIIVSEERIEAASGRLAYVVTSRTDSRADLLLIVEEFNVNPFIRMFLPPEHQQTPEQLIGVAAASARLTSSGSGFTFSEEFTLSSDQAVDDEYKFVRPHLSIMDAFASGIYRTPASGGQLIITSEMVSVRNGLSGGIVELLFNVAGGTGAPSISANPNPIQVCEGTLGQTTITWSAPAVSNVAVRVGSPGGTVLANGQSGTAQTGLWVSDGMEFFLVNEDNASTLASVVVTHTADGCAFPTQIILPRAVAGPDWATIFQTLNLGTNTRQFELQLYREDGTPWSNQSVLDAVSGSTHQTDETGRLAIQAEGLDARRFKVNGDSPATDVGYIVLKADPSLATLSGFLEYAPAGVSTIPGEPLSRVGLPASPIGRRFFAPFDTDTAVAVVNPSQLDITVVLRLTSAGQEEMTTIELSPFESQAFFVREKSALQFGQMSLSSEDLFTALALIFPDSGVFTSLQLESRE